MHAGPPIFSIIMPVFNEELYLKEAIESILAQSFRDWELILGDDGSKDGSPDIIEFFCKKDQRIHSFHQTNRGAAATRNAAISMAQADWLCYLDGDDIWLPQTLEAYYNYRARHPDVRFIYGYRHRLQDGKVTYSQPYYQTSPTGTSELFTGSFLSTMCVCHQKALIQLVGGYDENLPLCEDYDLFLRMSRHVTFEPINLATGLRRRHDKNLSRQTGFSRLIEAGVLLRFLEECGGKDIIPPAVVAQRLGKLFYAAGREYFRSRCFRQSLEALRYGEKYALPFKAKLIQILVEILLPWGKEDGRTSPIPLGPPRWEKESSRGES